MRWVEAIGTVPSAGMSNGATTAEWLTAIGTVTASAIALALGLGAREWLRRPRLSLHSEPDSLSDRIVTGTSGGNPAAYVRVQVRNDGHSSARNVQVTLLSVEDWMSNMQRWLARKPELDGRPLSWSNNPQATTVDIPPHVARHLDVVSILRDYSRQGMMPLVVSIQSPYPVNAAHVLNPGSWRIQLEVSGDNLTATLYEMQITFDGAWPADPPERIWETVAIRGPARRIDDARPPRPALRGATQQLEEAVAAEDQDDLGS